MNRQHVAMTVAKMRCRKCGTTWEVSADHDDDRGWYVSSGFIECENCGSLDSELEPPSIPHGQQA